MNKFSKKNIDKNDFFMMIRFMITPQNYDWTIGNIWEIMITNIIMDIRLFNQASLMPLLFARLKTTISCVYPFPFGVR